MGGRASRKCALLVWVPPIEMLQHKTHRLDHSDPSPPSSLLAIATQSWCDREAAQRMRAKT